jgi:hypothetical protein
VGERRRGLSRRALADGAEASVVGADPMMAARMAWGGGWGGGEGGVRRGEDGRGRGWGGGVLGPIRRWWRRCRGEEGVSRRQSRRETVAEPCTIGCGRLHCHLKE